MPRRELAETQPAPEYRTPQASEPELHRVVIGSGKVAVPKMVDRALQGEPTVVIRRGCPEAVLISYTDWQRFVRLEREARRAALVARARRR